MPTLTELMGLKPDIKFDGKSLLPLATEKERIAEPEMYITECAWQRKHGWRTPEWKLIVALEPDFHYKEPKELYNLIKDPGETCNVIKQNPEIASALEKRMLEHIKKREKETGRTAPIYTNLKWNDHGKPFESSDEAYNTLHIGDVGAAKRLQAQKED
jgi:arylsulfatase A-like enzyme